jgi:predicted amidohydrolase
MTRVAAINLSAQVGQVEWNLAECARLGELAGLDGAEWIVLPEFFTTGVAFRPELVDAALPEGGEATALLKGLAQRHGARVGGSFLCRDADGEVRNAFFLYGPNGELVGRHDKDLPTMWENCFYVGGSDAGRLAHGELTVGVAMCWELIRAQTARRLRERVDLVVGGSCWWSVPRWWPGGLFDQMERQNAQNATAAAVKFAGLVGAPVAHAAHCGPIDCRMPWTPVPYRGHAEGGAAVIDADGSLLAFCSREDGSGVAIADVELGRRNPSRALPENYWLCERGPLPSLAWRYQRLHGRRWYRRHNPPARRSG